MIRKVDDKWVVYDSSGEKVLGEHESEEEAKAQLKAIEARKTTRVNVRVAVNAKAIRREMHNGREHIVVPSFTLPDGIVMNAGLYPKDEIDKSYAGLEGTPAPLGHPQVDGEYVSALRPDAINAYHIGAWNRNVKRDGKRVSVEKWIDVEYAKNSEGGRRVLEAIEKGEPIHTSTGIFLEQEKAPSGLKHKWIARNMHFDHDAILIGQPGAATPDDGVGMLVNRQLVINSEIPDMQVNEDALEDSYGAKRDLLNSAIYERFGGGEVFAYLEDFNDQYIVYCVGSDKYRIGYHWEEGNPVLHEDAVEVQAKTEYMIKNAAESWMARFMGMFKNVVQFDSVTNKTPDIQANEEIEMTPEELQAALDAQAEKLTGAFNARLDALAEENKAMRDSLKANADALVADKRKAVSAEFGEVVANALQGEALDEMFAKVQKAAPIVGGFTQNSESDQWKDYSLNSHMEAK